MRDLVFQIHLSNSRCESAFPWRDASGLLMRTTLEKQRAQGKPGARCTRSLACKIKKHTSVVTTGSPEQAGLPCAMVSTAYFVLSPATNSSCHRHRRIKVLSVPVGPT